MNYYETFEIFPAWGSGGPWEETRMFYWPQQSLTPSPLPSTLSACFWPAFFTSSLIKAQAKAWSSRHAALFRFSSSLWSVQLSLVTSTTVLSCLTVTQRLHHHSIFDMWYKSLVSSVTVLLYLAVTPQLEAEKGLLNSVFSCSVSFVLTFDHPSIFVIL